MVLVLSRGTSSLSRADLPLREKKKKAREREGRGGRAAGVSPQLVLTFVDVDHLDWEGKPRRARSSLSHPFAPPAAWAAGFPPSRTGTFICSSQPVANGGHLWSLAV